MEKRGPRDHRGPSDWRSRMDRMMQQQKQELTQLHQTVGHLTNQLEAHVAREEAQWRRMVIWMQEIELKWDTCDVGDRRWVAGNTNIITMVMKGAAPSQKSRETERGKAVRMDGGGLEA